MKLGFLPGAMIESRKVLNKVSYLRTYVCTYIRVLVMHIRAMYVGRTGNNPTSTVLAFVCQKFNLAVISEEGPKEEQVIVYPLLKILFLRR